MGLIDILLSAIGLIPVFILVVIGFLIKYKKAYWLISGYNTMSVEKKKNVNIEKLARFVAYVCFILAAIIFVAFIFMFIGEVAISGIIFALMLPVIIFTLINAQKFDGNNFNSEGKIKTGTKVIIGSVIAVVVFIAIGVGVLLSFSNKPAEYALENGILNISGMYGQEVAINKINSLELKDTMPEVLAKTNGSALGTMLKGYFKLEGIDKAKLFVDTSKPPFIFVKTNSMTIILNCEESEKTKALHEKLETEWQKSAK